MEEGGGGGYSVKFHRGAVMDERVHKIGLNKVGNRQLLPSHEKRKAIGCVK